MGYRTSFNYSFRKVLLFSLRHLFYIVGTIVFIAGVIAYALDRSGDNYPKYTIAVDTSWDDCLRADLRIVCVEGHAYYFAIKLHRVIFAPKLNDDGTPVKCIVQKEKELK